MQKHYRTTTIVNISINNFTDVTCSLGLKKKNGLEKLFQKLCEIPETLRG